MRTTIDIDAPVLKELKRPQEREGKSLGRLVSEILAAALKRRVAKPEAPAEFRWTSHPMVARVDLADREAILSVMEPQPSRRPGKRRR